MAEGALDSAAVVPLTSSVAIGKLLNLSRPLFPICWVKKLELAVGLHW